MYIKIYDAYLIHKKIKVALIIYNFEIFFFFTKKRSSDLNSFSKLSLLVKLRIKSFPAGIYLHRVNNRNTKTIRDISSKLTTETQKQRH